MTKENRIAVKAPFKERWKAFKEAYFAWARYNPYKEDAVPKWDKIWDEIEKEYDWPEHFVDKRQVCLKIRQRTQLRYDRETKLRKMTVQAKKTRLRTALKAALINLI